MEAPVICGPSAAGTPGAELKGDTCMVAESRGAGKDDRLEGGAGGLWYSLMCCKLAVCSQSLLLAGSASEPWGGG